jgi:hypothetical protein
LTVRLKPKTSKFPDQGFKSILFSKNSYIIDANTSIEIPAPSEPSVVSAGANKVSDLQPWI